MSSFCPKIKPSFLAWVPFVLPVLFMPLSGQTVRWGTHKGPASPLNQTFPPPTNWAANPTSIQKLLDIGGNDLVNTTVGPASWGEGDLIELGFFASTIVGTVGGGDDTASSNLFEGTWVPLTTKTYVGQDWASGDAVGAGEFAFVSEFTPDFGETLPWKPYVVHNDSGHADWEVKQISGTTNYHDTPTGLQGLLSDMDSNTKLGIRFYDSTGTNNGTTKYNTVMNNNWTWDPTGVTEMYLHDSSSPHAVDTNLVFEFDNTTYGSVSKTGDIDVDDHGDFVSTITYWTGLNSNLTLTSSDQNHVLSGLNDPTLGPGDTIGNITGGSNNKLTLHVYGDVSTSNSYIFSGDIVDTGTAGGLEIVKTGSGKQTLTGSLDMVSDENSILNIHQGTLALAAGTDAITSTVETHSVEYLKGQAGTTLELADGDSDLITLGFANTTSYSDADFGGNVLISGNDDQKVTVSSGT
jgi:hypothetical protein